MIENAEQQHERVVHRHQFSLSGSPFTLPIYDDAALIMVDRKKGDPFGVAQVWEHHRTDLVRPAVVPERWFQVVGTGHPIECPAVYVGSWQVEGFVWHLFEVEQPA